MSDDTKNNKKVMEQQTMRYLYVLVASLMCSVSMAHAADTAAELSSARCLNITNLMIELKSIGGLQWIAFELNKDGHEEYLVFQQAKPDGTTLNKDGGWIVAERNSADQPDIYCLLAQGNGVEPLGSLHDTTFPDRYGLPGSGFPRCGNPADPWEGFKVRAWATRELGKSFVIAHIGAVQFTLIVSEAFDYWVLLEKKRSAGTCYYDRGIGVSLRRFQITL